MVSSNYIPYPFLSSPLSLQFVLSLSLCIDLPLAGALSSRFNFTVASKSRSLEAIPNVSRRIQNRVLVPRSRYSPSGSRRTCLRQKYAWEA